MKELNQEMIASFRKQYEENEHLESVSAVAQQSLDKAAFLPMQAAKLNGEFTYTAKVRGITNQKQSGRCWLFATMNILREAISDKCNLKSFELSQNYLAFYDKLEKANNFLQEVIDHADEPLTGQMMMYVLNGVSDGGFFGMARDLVKKYGIVPKDVMPESYQSEHTSQYLHILNGILRKDAQELREMVRNHREPYARKEEMMAEVYRTECIAYGKPPVQFDFSYTDDKDTFHEERNLTPLSFLKKYAGNILDDYVVVLDTPIEKVKKDTPVIMHTLGNMPDKSLFGLNLSSEEMADLCLKQLKDKQPIWFTCDASTAGERQLGVWDQNSFSYQQLFGYGDITMSKGDQLMYRQSENNHAMVLTGVHVDEKGNPDRWQIENSWGEENGKKGMYVCSNDYFNRYVYETVINKKYFSIEQLEYLKKQPIELEPWLDM